MGNHLLEASVSPGSSPRLSRVGRKGGVGASQGPTRQVAPLCLGTRLRSKLDSCPTRGLWLYPSTSQPEPGLRQPRPWESGPSRYHMTSLGKRAGSQGAWGESSSSAGTWRDHTGGAYLPRSAQQPGVPGSHQGRFGHTGEAPAHSPCPPQLLPNPLFLRRAPHPWTLEKVLLPAAVISCWKHQGLGLTS